MPARLRRAPSLAELAREVEVAELAVEVALRREDVESGFVPARARRARFPHEVAAGVNFAEVEQVVDDAAARMLARVELATQRAAAALEAHLRTLPNGRAMIEFLAGLDDPARRAAMWPGYAEAVAGLPAEVADELRRVVDDGALQALGEARRQGVPVAALGDLGDLTDEQRRRLDLGRDRIANIPGNRVRDLSSNWIHNFPVFNFEGDPDALAKIFRANVVDVPSGLAGADIRAEAQQAHGVGRQRGAAGVARPARIYASELLDRSTCGPCSLVDGREYASEAAARLDYPHGVYRACEGGARCRGTLVFVWSTEEPATPGEGNLPPAPPGRGGRPGDPILDLGGQGGAARIELSRRALRDVHGVELADGQRVRISGGNVHGRAIVAGTLEARRGRLLFVEDGIGDDPGPLLDILDGYLARIPDELGTGGLDLLALSNNDYELPSAIGGTTAATSSGDTIVFWRGFGHRADAGDGELFDHELGHSAMHHWNNTLGPAARVTDAGDRVNVNDPAWRLGRAGSDPGYQWAEAMQRDADRALAAEERLGNAARKLARERPDLVGTDEFDAEIERRIARMRGDNRAAMATIRPRFRETNRPAGSFAARPGGIGTYDGRSAPGVSDYGSSKPVEDWAEAFRLYLRDRRDGRLGETPSTLAPVTFADLYPARAELLDALFAGGRTYHRRLGAGGA